MLPEVVTDLVVCFPYLPCHITIGDCTCRFTAKRRKQAIHIRADDLDFALLVWSGKPGHQKHLRRETPQPVFETLIHVQVISAERQCEFVQQLIRKHILMA